MSGPRAGGAVAVVEPVGGHGGMNYYDFGLCGGLARIGVPVTLYTCDETEPPPEPAFTVRIPYRGIFGTDPLWRRGIRYLIGSLRAIPGARFRGSRVCHLHFFHVGPFELLNVLLAKGLGMRVIVTAHDVEAFAEGLTNPRLLRLAYGLSDRVIAHNEVARRELADSVGVPEDRLAVVPHGHYLQWASEMPDRRVARERLGIDPRAKVLLFFGQIKKVKGLDLLLRALPRVLEAHPDTVLVIAGKVWKDDFARYRKLIDRLGLSAHCIARIEYIPDQQVPVYYAAADLVVLPYRRIYQSGVLLMAMSFRRPVLAADLPGMTEIVRDGETGFLFPTGDTDSMAAKIIDVLSDPELRECVAERGWRYVEVEHDWDGIASHVARQYREALET